jgi:hypothetical protein
MGDGVNSDAFNQEGTPNGTFSPLIVLLDKNCAVHLYASGKNTSSFMKLINNRMYALTLRKGKDAIVDGDGSEDDNEILGATSVVGMPLSRDVTMKEMHGDVVEDL